MGSERKSKRRRSPSNSISEDEGRTKKQRTKDEKERSSSKREKKEKLKSKKSRKHSKHSDHSDKGKKAEEKHNRKRHKRSHHSFQELSNEDYFSKNNEFATWLKEERGVFFSDLSSEAARELFSGFIKDWNNQKLESRYYEGITTGPRTAHNWKITRK